MAAPLIALNAVGQFNGLVDILGAVERHRHRQLLARERIIRAEPGFGDNKKRLALGQSEARHAGDLLRRLRDNRSVQMAIDPDGVLQLFFLVARNDVTALLHQLVEHCIIDAVEQHHRIVRRARSREIKRLGNADFFGSVIQIGGIIHGDHRVADADAERRGARRIRSKHHRPTASCQHAVTLAHHFVGLFHRGGFNLDHQIGRSAHLDQSFAHEVTDHLVGDLGARVGRDDDRVAALDGRNRLDHRGRLGVGRGGQCADHTDRLGDLDQIACLVFLDHTYRLVVDDVHQCGAGLAEDLEVLAVIIAELGFIDGVLGNRLGNVFLGYGPDHATDQAVDLFLRVIFDLRLRGTAARNQNGDLACFG